jgi:hypothetical protein
VGPARFPRARLQAEAVARPLVRGESTRRGGLALGECVLRCGAVQVPVESLTVSSKRRRVSGTFTLAAVLVIVSLFVLDGAVSGVAALAAMLVFIAACIQALRGEGGEAVDRTGLAGWFGGWF